MIPYRYVFVGGLHRSGTSLVARIIARHPEVSAIDGAPVPENEGVYLQGAIPHTAQHGRPGHFATDPAQHLIEASPFDSLATRLRMEADWAPWFDPSRPWRVEKSPVNLTRTRLYQQLFPLAQFVIVLRHPQAVAQAMAKWTDRAPSDLIDYWLDAHDRLTDDLPYLHAAMLLRYEDLISSPAAAEHGLHAFLGLASAGQPVADVRDGNADYSPALAFTRRQRERAVAWGYCEALQTVPIEPFLAHPLRSITEAVRKVAA